jgi:TPP-dependent pyruvate/acetoin dehydrogenase alpha subunit
MSRLHEPRAALVYSMMRIRCAEETLADRYREQEMRTPTHFSIGQEAVAVGVCAALKRDDVVYSGHRCHAHYLAKGGDLPAMVAELYGKETGCARGRGGSVHLNDPAVGVIASSAILGQTMAAAVGSALAFKLDGSERVAVTFFGDGTVEEGIFHESLNFAEVKRLPVIFVCENNGYSTHTALSVRQREDIPIHERAKSYGIATRLVDGNDVFAVNDVAREIVGLAREGHGPLFVECTTYRWREHVGPLWDYDKGYRTREDVESWIARCPIRRATDQLVVEGVWTRDDVRVLETALAAEVEQAITLAKAAPFPSTTELTVGTY